MVLPATNRSDSVHDAMITQPSRCMLLVHNITLHTRRHCQCVAHRCSMLQWGVHRTMTSLMTVIEHHGYDTYDHGLVSCWCLFGGQLGMLSMFESRMCLVHGMSHWRNGTLSLMPRDMLGIFLM